MSEGEGSVISVSLVTLSSVESFSAESVSFVIDSSVSDKSMLYISVSAFDGFFSDEEPQAHKDNISEAKRRKDIIFLI